MTESKTKIAVLEVTEEIIQRAVPRNSGHCIVADAVRAAFPDCTRLEVDLQAIKFSRPESGKRYIYLTPAPAQHILIDFDLGVRPEPQSFRLGRPVQIVSMRKHITPSPRKPGEHRQQGDPDRARVEIIAEKVVKMEGRVPPVAALADPPKQRVVNGRRYAGQRRSFGLRILQP